MTGSSSPLSGLLLAAAAAAGNNLGKGLQKAATRQLPQLNLARKEVVICYLRSPIWLVGLALDVAGGAAMLAALAAAPVSVVQPVAAFGLVLLAAFSHVVLQEHLTARQWRGAAVATLGIIAMGFSSSSSSSSSNAHDSDSSNSSDATTAAAAAAAVAGVGDQPSPMRVLTCFTLLLLLLAAEVYWRQQHEAAAAARRKRAGAAAGVGAAAVAEAAAAADAAACGVEAGCCFGFSAAAARTGFQLSKTLGWMFAPLGVICSLCLTSSGFVLQTRGFKHGSALVVCTAAAAASIVAGVLVGLFALSEPLPATLHMRLLLLLSWAAVFAGISSMAATESNSVIFSVSNMSHHSHDGRYGNASPTHAAAAAAGSSHMSSVRHRVGEFVQTLLLLPRILRRRVLLRKTQQWWGRSSSGSSRSGWLWGRSGSSSSSAVGGSSSSSSGPGLPLSRSTPDFGDVLAPMGGARRP